MTDEKKTPTTIAEIREAIIDEANTDDVISDLPRLKRFAWFARRTPIEVGLLYPMIEDADPQAGAKRDHLLSSMNPLVFVTGGPCAHDRRFVIVEMFQDDTDYRVYAVPTHEFPKERPTLFKFSKLQATFSETVLIMDGFVSAIANEWSEVDDDIFTLDRERSAVIDYLNTLPEGYACKRAAEDIEHEAHYPADDEDEEEETPVNGAAPNAPVTTNAEAE